MASSTKANRRRYFVVKHDLRSFLAFPGRVWNSYSPADRIPKWFRQIRAGDQWVSFAYTQDGESSRRVSLVTGVYECVQEYHRGQLTKRARETVFPRSKKWAWIIRGKPIGPRLSSPVVVPPLPAFTKRQLFHRNTVLSLTGAEFRRICRYVAKHHFDPAKIPCLGREPLSEQEVLAIVVAHSRKLGIEQIIKIQTRFPDMLVKLRGRSEPVHLELELYSTSFIQHAHSEQMRAKRFDGAPVAILCWVDDDRTGTLKRWVDHVIALSDLLRESRRIHLWRR
jgi:hypothetical protein